MDSLEILKKTREWFDDDSHWCQKDYTRNAQGLACPTSEAASTCLIGGFLLVANGGEIDTPNLELKIVSDCIGVVSIVDWNDAPERTPQDIRNALDCAIRKVEVQLEPSNV